MIYILFIATIIKVIAAAGNLESPIAGYTAVPMVFHAVNMTSMTKVLLRGTVQEIQSQLDSNKDIEVDLSPLVPLIDRPSSLTSRNEKIHCWIGGTGEATNQPLQDGIDYLKGLPGPCSAAPGPRVCTRISCSWNAAIWFCNDTPREKFHDCADLANFAVDIRTECHLYREDTYLVRGQKFDDDDFNVIVGRDSC